MWPRKPDSFLHKSKKIRIRFRTVFSRCASSCRLLAKSQSSQSSHRPWVGRRMLKMLCEPNLWSNNFLKTEEPRGPTASSTASNTKGAMVQHDQSMEQRVYLAPILNHLSTCLNESLLPRGSHGG